MILGLHSLIPFGQLVNAKVYVGSLSCQLAKELALPFNKNGSISFVHFDLVRSVFQVSSPNSTLGGSKYFAVLML